MGYATPRRTPKVVRSSWRNPPTRFFHGTSSALLDSIRADGLRPLVYLADSVGLAAAYGLNACGPGGGRVVVLEVFDIDPDKLWPDDNAMGFPVNCPDSCLDEIDRLIELDGWRYGRAMRKAWPVSWAAVGSVCYDGTARSFRVVAED